MREEWAGVVAVRGGEKEEEDEEDEEEEDDLGW